MGFIVNRKQWILFLEIFIILFLFSGCFVDVFAGKRPYDHPNTRWVCEDPEITLIFSASVKNNYEIRGTVMDYPNDMTLEFGPGDRMTFYSRSLARELFRCRCSFSSNKMRATVVTDELFDGKYLNKAIVFYRYDIEEESLP